MGRESHIAISAKVFALVAPCVLVGVSFTDAVKHNVVAFLALTNVLSESPTSDIPASTDPCSSGWQSAFREHTRLGHYYPLCL